MFSLLDTPEPPEPLGPATDLDDYLYRALAAEANPEAQDDQEKIFALWRADGDIVNGGFAQMLVNFADWDLVAPSRGFRRVGLTAFAEIFERALSAVGPAPPPPGEARRRWMTQRLDGTAEPKRSDIPLRPLLKSFDEQYYNLKRQYEARTPNGFLYPICKYIEDRRTMFFPGP